MPRIDLRVFLVSTVFSISAFGFSQTLAQVTLSPGRVSSGEDTMGKVLLTEPAPADLWVDLTSSSIQVTVPSRIKIISGNSVGNFRIITKPSTSYGATITAKLGNVKRFATLWVGYEQPYAEITSVSSEGVQGHTDSGEPVGVPLGDSRKVSADGRFVVFTSSAPNLVPFDTNSEPDVFLRDRRTGKTRCLSVNPLGRPANGPSFTPAISTDGRYAVFASQATNVIEEGWTGRTDIFLVRLADFYIRRVSRGRSGNSSDGNSFQPTINADGSVVAYASDATNLVPHDTNRRVDVLCWGRFTNLTQLVSLSASGTQANADSSSPSLSADGTVISFTSDAHNLVDSDSNGYSDIFVRNTGAGTTERVSLLESGEQIEGPSLSSSISADGSRIAFNAPDIEFVPTWTNPIRCYVRDRSNNSTFMFIDSYANYDSDVIRPSISGDGLHVGYLSQNYKTGAFDDARVFLVGSYGANRVAPLATDISLSASARWVACTTVDRTRVSYDANGKADVFAMEVVAPEVISRDILQLSGTTQDLRIELTQSAPPGGATVALAQTRGTSLTIPPTVFIPEGSRSTTIPIAIPSLPLDSPYQIQATYASRVANLTITPSEYRMEIGQTVFPVGTRSIRVTLRAARVTGEDRPVLISGSYQIFFHSTIIVPAGKALVSFLVSLPPDLPKDFYYLSGGPGPTVEGIVFRIN